MNKKQVGSFLGKLSAKKLRKKLGKKGYSERMRRVALARWKGRSDKSK